MARKRPFILAGDKQSRELKASLKRLLEHEGVPYDDIGVISLVAKEYPACVYKAAIRVSEGSGERAIVVDSSGVAASIAANRFPGVRAVFCTDPATARIARRHADANMLVLSSSSTTPSQAAGIVRQWLRTKPVAGEQGWCLRLVDEDTKLKAALGHLDRIDAARFARTSGSDQLLLHRARKGAEHIKKLVNGERRGTSEPRLPEFCPVTFTRNGDSVSAILTNLSHHGAQLRLGVNDERFELPPGERQRMRVRTPYGASECEGEVVWFDGSFYPTWGVRFTRLSDRKDDPLRSLMNDM